MERGKVVFVPCAFHRGAFPHERVFIIRLDGGWEYRGVAPVDYCFASDHRPLGDAPAHGAEVGGWITGIQITPAEDGVARVYLPDGDVYELAEGLLISASRTGRDIHIPVES